ncbi:MULTISPECIES: LysR family transcriptional regulator [Sneathiella]|jgi:DNA-binding transcriptional LysR family regulator|uniref:LysR family transcriptional regulator n=1 Tax=Sneathiella TaxID=510690 RepID=UPI00146B1227|nr:LysR family transcriptional regulator [Sneathiella aquimaris]
MHHPSIRYIDEVARQGSIRKAAKVLNVASSAINRQILKLEEEFGMRLFDRVPEGVELTPAGKVIVEHCRKTLYYFNQARAEIDDIRELKTGHIRIAAIDSMVFDFLPRVLKDFSSEYPGVSFSVETLGPGEINESIARGETDIGLNFTNQVNSLHPELRVFAEVPAPLGLLAAPNHPLADRDFVNIEDCIPFQQVRTLDARRKSSFIDLEIDTIKTPLSTIFYTNSHVMAKQAILSGIGIGIYTKIGFLSEVENREVRFIPFQDNRLKDYSVGNIVSAHQNLGKASYLFAKLIERHLRNADFV